MGWRVRGDECDVRQAARAHEAFVHVVATQPSADEKGPNHVRLTAIAFSLCGFLAAACSTAPNPTAPSVLSLAPTAEFPSVPNAVSTPLANDGSALLAPIRQATANYHDVAKAIAGGYQAPDAAEWVASPDGGMGVHAVNPALLSDQVIDPLGPEVLLYEPKKNGGFRLVGVEHVQAVLVRNRATGIVSPWFAPTPWPAAEYDVITPRSSGGRSTARCRATSPPCPGTSTCTSGRGRRIHLATSLRSTRESAATGYRTSECHHITGVGPDSPGRRR
jgi:hypothetical protein